MPASPLASLESCVHEASGVDSDSDELFGAVQDLCLCVIEGLCSDGFFDGQVDVEAVGLFDEVSFPLGFLGSESVGSFTESVGVWVSYWRVMVPVSCDSCVDHFVGCYPSVLSYEFLESSGDLVVWVAAHGSMSSSMSGSLH